MRAARALLPAMLLVVAAPPAPSGLKPPSLTREQMEAALSAESPVLVVYGTRDPAASPTLRERALAIASRLSEGDSAAVRADREATAPEMGGRMLVPWLFLAVTLVRPALLPGTDAAPLETFVPISSRAAGSLA